MRRLVRLHSLVVYFHLRGGGESWNCLEERLKQSTNINTFFYTIYEMASRGTVEEVHAVLFHTLLRLFSRYKWCFSTNLDSPRMSVCLLLQ